MAAPVPPAGAQSQHTERPLKVYAEQYVEGAPLPIGVHDRDEQSDLCRWPAACGDAERRAI